MAECSSPAQVVKLVTCVHWSADHDHAGIVRHIP